MARQVRSHEPPAAARGRRRRGERRFAGLTESCFPPEVRREDQDLQADGELEIEARLFARYLLGGEAAPEPIARYVAANRVLLRDPWDPRDAAVLGFVHRHPWSVSLLDAACGLLRPTGLLRSKLLIMAAILEASPAHADDFLPRASSTPLLLARLAALGALAAGRALAGVVLYLPASRRRP